MANTTDFTLVVTNSDGTVTKTPISVPNGKDGANGKDGKDGAKGDKGSDGVGIRSIDVTQPSDTTARFTFSKTDNTSSVHDIDLPKGSGSGSSSSYEVVYEEQTANSTSQSTFKLTNKGTVISMLVNGVTQPRTGYRVEDYVVTTGSGIILGDIVQFYIGVTS